MSLLALTYERLLPVIEDDLKDMLAPRPGYPEVFYSMLHYHMGWVDEAGITAQAMKGKRIRPVLCLLVCEASSGDFNPARPSAAAVEIIHNFSLLHDDIQDESPTRRNRPTVWSVWNKPQAINAGDALYTLAFLSLSSLPAQHNSPQMQAKSLAILGETCLELTRGQHLDMDFEARDEVQVDDYLAMITGKTAALLSGAARLGAVTANASQEHEEHYADFGLSLGLAFQVLDDILDIWGDPALTGKQASIDIYQRKKSLPVLHGIAHSEELQELYKADMAFDDKMVQRVVALLDKTGSREYAEDLARSYSEQTTHHLEAASPAGQAGEALHEMVNSLLNRKF